MRLTVNVTQTDIDTARLLELRPVSYWCPVARALERATRRAVWVQRTFVQIGNAGTPEPIDSWTPVPFRAFPHIDLPKEAQAFIYDYDHDRIVEPFSFTLDLADEETQPA